MNDEQIRNDTEFLAELLIDPGMMTGNPTQCKTEVGKRALEIFQKFENCPERITFGDLQDLVSSEGSQIGNQGAYLSHIANTAGVFRSLVRTLEQIQSGLSLPDPDIAYATGLVHDLNATFSDYGKGGQQSKEFDEFVLAKRPERRQV